MTSESHSAIDEAAGDWLARRDTGHWSDADQAAFERWLNESPLHRVAFLRLEDIWERSRRLKALGAGIAPGEVPASGRWNLSPFFERAESPQTSASCSNEQDTPALHAPTGDESVEPKRRRVLHALAAGLVLMGIGWFLWPTGVTYRTPVGGIASVPISDGSKVTLNTDSKVRIAITERERRIELERGEAFFEVAKDPGRPFVVSAGDQRVIAVGTKFSVRREAGEVVLVVTEGRVRVQSAAPSTRTDATPLLSAGTIAHASDAGVLLEKKSVAEAEEVLSWRSGVLVFRNVSLAAAIAEFNRYNTRPVVIEDADIAEFTVAGNFRATNVDAFVRLLESGYPLRVEQRDDRIVLSRR
jgi:transmembrane sensor